jgi:glycosyltransferase involved in cell wall biosynthesis
MNNRDFGPRVLGARFSLSCVVPVLNEGAQIERFLESLHQAIDQLASVEIVVVNDGSTDNSADEIAKLCERLPLHYLELSRNFGKETAIQAGLDVASGDCVVILDADFQHPISIIPSMIDR